MKIISQEKLVKRGGRSIRYCLIFLFLSFVSCKKSFNNNKLDNKLVVFAEITAEDTIRVSIGKSMLVGNGMPISFEKINNASVTITPQNQSGWPLDINTSFDYFNNPTVIYTNKNIINYNTGYLVNVKHALLGNATANTIVPGPFDVLNVNTEEDEVNSQDVLKFSFAIVDPATEKNYYIFEAVKQLVNVSDYFYWQGVRYNYNTEDGEQLYRQVEDEPGVVLAKDTMPTNKFIRLSLFTKDNNTTNGEIGSLDSSFNRIFVTDSIFNGKTFPYEFSVSQQRFEADSPDERGWILIQVKSVSKALYDYLYLYEKYKSDFGSIPTGQLTSPPGNIGNGLGVFGGVSKREWRFYYDDLE